MESILSLIEKSQSHIPGAEEQLLIQMTPLVRKYAAKVHFMDYEDAVQEFYLALLEALPYLDTAKGEGNCLSYMKTAVLHRYYTLCKNGLSEPLSEDIENYSVSLEGSSGIDETYYDVVSYINIFPPDSLQFQILSRCFFEGKSDKEIAQELHISRQYVNRIKKKLIAGYLSL